MFTANLYVFAALSIALLVLSFLTVFLASRHDKAVSLAGPLEEEGAVLARIAEKRATLTDLELDLEQRRKALAAISDIQAEVDALIRQRDTLMVEWNQSAERRREIEVLRLETEAAEIAKVEADAASAEVRTQLEALRDRLTRADEVARRIETLTAERETLERSVRALEDAARDLEAHLTDLRADEARVAALAAEGQHLADQLAEAQGRLTARGAELAEVDERLTAAKFAAVGVRAEAEGLAAGLAAGKLRQSELLDEIEAQSAKLATLLAREAKLTRSEEDLKDLHDDLADARAETQELAAGLAAGRLRQSELLSEIEAESAKLAALLANEIELTRSEQDLDDLRDNLAGIRADHVEAATELAVARQKLAETSEENTRALEHFSKLETRKAVLEREIEKSRALASGQGPEEEDPLRELRDPPEVVTQLRNWPVQSNPSESEALLRVKKRFDAFGLDYPDRVLRAFHTAMKVNETTQMAVLSGISGTGKSQLPRQYAAGMGIGFLQVPVQPRWDSPQDLMGFYNYIEGRFRPTDMARALFALDTQNNQDAVHDRLLMVLLDEMNLARVEYYFSDFLSRLESRPVRGRVDDRNLRKDAEIELEIPRAAQRIFPGYNLLFAGTMNEDESTQSLSDKVIDRANILRFGAPKKIARVQKAEMASAEQALDRRQWEKWCARGLDEAGHRKATEKVDEMLSLMQGFGKPFGHRLGRAILAYAGAYPDWEGIGDRVDMALSDQIEMRLLPKLRGIDVEEKSTQFEQLRKMASDLGDDSLAEAIRTSVDAAEVTGQFLWKGVVR